MKNTRLEQHEEVYESYASVRHLGMPQPPRAKVKASQDILSTHPDCQIQGTRQGDDKDDFPHGGSISTDCRFSPHDPPIRRIPCPCVRRGTFPSRSSFHPLKVGSTVHIVPPLRRRCYCFATYIDRCSSVPTADVKIQPLGMARGLD